MITVEKEEDVLQILDTLQEFGKAYVVGGAVRDHLLGKASDDVDIATNVSMKKIEELFETHDIGKNKDFGVSVIKFNDEIYEIANFRKDGIYSDGRRPDSVEITSSFKEDCKRRDFTINGLGMDSKGNIIDYVEGQKDLKNKIIRCIGDPEKRFQEDYLRMLRAIRFASTLNFEIDYDLFYAIQENAHKIVNISSERIYKELYKMASQTGEKFVDAIELLYGTSLLEHILPEIKEMDRYEHNPEYHPEGNVYQHVISALRQYRGNDPVVNLSILFHDVGKTVTRTYEDGDVRYHGHAYDGIKVAENICNRLKFPNDVKETVLFCVENHMKFHKFLEMKNSKIIKLILNKNWSTLYEVGLVDDICRGFDTSEFWNSVNEKVIKLHNKFVENKEFNEIKKVVSGNLIMELTGLKEGPEIGRVQKETTEWIIDNNINLDSIEEIHEYIKNIE